MTGGSAGPMTVTFGHGARHLAESGVSRADVEAAIEADIVSHLPAVGGGSRRIVRIDGFEIEYRAHRINEVRVHVGTYYLR